MSRYDDIINLPHRVSEKHPRTSMLDRAAQFFPFAALTGYGDATDEAARVTATLIELDNSERQEIGRTLCEAYKARVAVEITHFVPDERKAGEECAVTAEFIRYSDAMDAFKRIDAVVQAFLVFVFMIFFSLRVAKE